MGIGPTELFLFLISFIRIVIPALLIIFVILFYRRLKKIEERLRLLEEKMSETSKN
jgi:hypothetical protein